MESVVLSDECIGKLAKNIVTAMREPEPFISIEKVSELTGMPVSTIYKNDMPRYKRGKTLLFIWSEVLEWITRR